MPLTQREKSLSFLNLLCFFSQATYLKYSNKKRVFLLLFVVILKPFFGGICGGSGSFCKHTYTAVQLVCGFCIGSI